MDGRPTFGGQFKAGFQNSIQTTKTVKQNSPNRLPIKSAPHTLQRKLYKEKKN